MPPRAPSTLGRTPLGSPSSPEPLMKYGMNLLLWTGNVTAEHFPLLAKLKAAGFDGVEVPVFGGTPADYKPLRAELDKNGLKCTTVTILTKETNAVSPDAAVRQKASEWLKT